MYKYVFKQLKLYCETTLNEEVEFNDWAIKLNYKITESKPTNISVKHFFQEFVEFIEDSIELNDEYNEEQLLRWAVKQSFLQIHNKNR